MTNISFQDSFYSLQYFQVFLLIFDEYLLSSLLLDRLLLGIFFDEYLFSFLFFITWIFFRDYFPFTHWFIATSFVLHIYLNMFYFTLDISLKYLEIKKNLQKKTMIPTGNNNSLLDFSPKKNAYKMFNAYYFIQFYIFVFFGGFFQ